MAQGQRGPGRPNKLTLDWMEPESTFKTEHFPDLSQVELESLHRQLYIQAFQAEAAKFGGVLEGRNKINFKTAFKKRWGVLLIPDRKGHYFNGRLGDAPVWRVRYGDTTFVPTIADHATQQQRVWRGQFLTNAGVGTPLSLEQLKRKFIDPLTGQTLTAHHRDGLSEANPAIDDSISKLVNGQIYQKTKGKYGSLEDVKAGNREFQQFQRVFEKRKIAAGDVLEQFDMVLEGTHTKSAPTEMGGGAIHVQQSIEGVSTASGKPLTDKLPDGRSYSDLDVEARANAYVDEVERLAPIKDRIVKDAVSNPDLYPEPFENPPPIQRIKRGKDAGKPVNFWDQAHPAQTLLDNPDIGPEGVRQLTPKQGWPARLRAGVKGSGLPDIWTDQMAKTARQLGITDINLGRVSGGLGVTEAATNAVVGFGTGNIAQGVGGSVGLALNSPLAKKAIARALAERASKTALKGVSGLDVVLSGAEAYGYLTEGKFDQAVIAGLSGAVGWVPVVGDAAAAGLDFTNTGIDISRMDFNRKADVDLDVTPEYRQYKHSILRNLKL